MRDTGLNLVIACGVCFAATRAEAQPLFARAESVECTVVNSDLVFVARLVDFRPVAPGSGRDGCEVTIDIEETLKQEPAQDEPYRKLGLFLARPAAVLLDWRERSSRLLIAYDEDAPERTASIELAADRLEVMTADLTLLRDPDAVVRAARAAVTRLPSNVKRVHTFERHVPRDIVAGTRWEPYYRTGGHLRLAVPADHHLETRARADLRSDIAGRRAEGVRALVYFRTEENIALVRPLLNDPAVTYFQAPFEGTPGERIYGVRLSAYETLKAWRVEVPPPVTREAVR